MENTRSRNLLRNLGPHLAEFWGTFFLLFVGKGAIMVSVGTQSFDHLSVALAFGGVIALLIVAFGDLSGAHFNPAVTLGFALAGRFSWRDVPAYLLAQFAGGILGALVAQTLFGSHLDPVGATTFTLPLLQALGIEFAVSFFLMMVIFRVSSGPKEKGLFAALAVGTLIFIGALIAGPLTGGSFNPARSLGPALLEPNSLGQLWVYFLGPCLGTLSAGALEGLLPMPPSNKAEKN